MPSQALTPLQFSHLLNISTYVPCHHRPRYEKANDQIGECMMNKKVYTHMLERSKRELAVLKQKVGKMESRLGKKQAEETVKLQHLRKVQQEKEQHVTELERMEVGIIQFRGQRTLTH